ncbi:transcription factor 25 [Latimeria chalumnae]|uniref:Transcription factor 25 n=1 Tax=Latimeria chalumnae TaxID=7897 RepID=H3ANL2_LATCH|nr:PREDICTED: transcription factor 25 [Latimeria chalumnae]|eukprot:XP_005999258.1 PREDICTED: transcription factor 25 [Latimeria chalumnae]
MSRRALRRLRGEQRGQEPLGPEDLQQLGVGKLGDDREEEKEEEPELGEDSVVVESVTRKQGKKLLHKRGINNLFELINDADTDNVGCIEADPPVEGDMAASRLSDSDSHENDKETAKDNKNKESERQTGGQDQEADLMQASLKSKPRKKKKKKKTKKLSAGEVQEGDEDEDIDGILEKIENANGLSYHRQNLSNADSRPLLYVEHRNLNPETELKRFFGARAVLGDQRLRQRQRQYHRSTWLTVPKDTWPRYSKTGISMRLLETKDGIQYYAFEHNKEYMQVQFKFLDAVDSMDPNNIVLLLRMYPYHIDSLLQLCDVCRIQDDQEMARDLIERALYSFECAFHPVFSLTNGTCRLDYRRQENRAFFLALFKHMVFLEKRGCPRTALEFCKLILSLDPDNDPLCLLLIIDFLSLRAKEYLFLTRMFEEWEAHRNLSQLPNFAYSVSLVFYLLSQQDDLAETEGAQLQEKADHMIQTALIMFPGVLMPLLDHCSVQPDAAVASHPFFGPQTQIGQLPALNQLISLYLGRTHTLWKDIAIMNWLEANVKEVLQRVDAGDQLVEEAEKRRKLRYQSAPRNIYRHVILSELREATAALPLEVTSHPVMGFDPLPPLDSVVSYIRPERHNRASEESTLSLFFRSLMPNFNLQPGVRPEEGAEGAGAGRELNQGVNRLMAAMRDMLANIQFQEPPREDNPEGDGDWD